MTHLSIVVPVYNESEGLQYFHESLLLPALQKLSKITYTVLYVNDGSKDNSLQVLKEIAARDNRVKVLNLARNFGKEIAITAGISHAAGDCTLIMDADGQHPPSKIAEFIEEWRNGGQVVIGVRNINTGEGYLKKYGSKIFYKLFNSTSGTELIPRSTDFRLIDSSVRDEFIKFSERNRITRGLIDWLGFDRRIVSFDAPARFAGEASYSHRQLVRLAINSFISLSITPLISLVFLGLAVTAGALLLAILAFVEHVILQDPLQLNITGSAYLVMFVTFLIGLVLTSQGIVAIYLSHVHAQSQGRPLYVIDTRDSVGIHANETSPK